jgi:hypothetical protein
MPVHPDYKMLSDDEDINMQLADGIYDPNDPSLFNAEQWAKRQYGAPQRPLTQPEQQSLQRNVEQYVPETNPVSGRNWYAPTPDTMPRQPVPGQKEVDPEQILQYLSQKNPAAKPLLEKARAKKQAPVRNEVFPDKHIIGRVPPLPGIDKEQAFGRQPDPFQMVKKSPSDMNEQEYKAYIAKMAELSRPDYVQERNEVFDGANIVGQVPPLPEEPRTDYYDGLPEWGGNEPDGEPMISEQVGQPPEPSQIVEQDLPPEPQVDERLANTTLGRMAMSAKDPRLLMAHLSQFAGELGNLRGKPTQSTALPFYQAQIGLEQQQRDNQFKQTQLDQSQQKLNQEKKSSSDPALAALRTVQADLAKNKLQTEQELLDPASERSQNLRETMRELAARQGYTFPKNDSLRGADVLPMLKAMVVEMQMNAQNQRSVMQTQSAEQRAQEARERAEQDRLWRAQNAVDERKFRAQEAEQNRNLQRELLKTRGEQQKDKILAPEKENVDQAARAQQVQQMLTENSRMDAILSDKDFDPTSRLYMGRMSLPVGMKGAKWQAYETTAKQFLEPILRKRTGAAVTEEELENQMQQSFPMPGDTRDVLAAKKVKRQQMIEEMKAWSGRSGRSIDTQAPSEQPKEAPKRTKTGEIIFGG